MFPDGLPDAVSGQHFVIKSVSEVRSGKRVYKQVEAHHVAFELNRYFLDDYIDFEAARPPEYLLAMVGNATPFTMGLTGNFTPQDVWEFGEKRKHALLTDIRALYDGELTYDNYQITLTTRAGENRGASVRYRKNLSGITRKSHDMERVTRLYGYGKNGLTIEGHAGYTVKYIDSAHFDPNHPYEDSVTFAEIEDQAALLSAMRKHLAERELPKVSYEIDFVQLEKVDPEFSSDAVRGVGDTVTVRDDELGFHFDARVIEYERFPFEPKRARVVLANFREFKSSDYVWQATVGSRKAIKYTSQNAVLKGIKYDDSITLVDGIGITVSDDLERIRAQLGQIAPGEYGVVLFNNSGNRTIWQDANTGEGRFAGRVIASIVEGGQVIGALIQGGTMTGATVQTSETYPKTMMSLLGNKFGSYTDAQTYMEILPGLFGEPGLRWTVLGDHKFFLGSNFGQPTLHGYVDILISSDRSVRLRPGSGYNVEIPDWSRLYSTERGQTLQTYLDVWQGIQQYIDSGQNTRIDNLQAQITNLSSTLSSLATAIANKSDKGHTHT